MLIRFFSHNNLQANVCASVYFPRRKKGMKLPLCYQLPHKSRHHKKAIATGDEIFFLLLLVHSPLSNSIGLWTFPVREKNQSLVWCMCVFFVSDWKRDCEWVRESSTGAVVGKVNRHFFQGIYIASAFHPYTTTTTTLIVMESIGRSLLEKMCRHFPVWIGNVERKRLEVWEFWVAAADSPSPPPLERPNRPKWVFSCFREGSKTGEEEKRGREKV